MSNLSPIATRYFWVLLFASVVVTALGVASLALLGRVPPPIMVILPPALAAFDAGKRFVRDQGTAPDEATAWKLSAIFLAIFVAVVLLLFGGVFAAQGVNLTALAPLVQPAIFFTFVFFLLIRLMIWIGTRLG